MRAMPRGKGLTPSEEYLSKLAELSFLNLWSYANPYIDKKNGKSLQGKELCDLLVVCGNDIIIFSDKKIEWPNSGDIHLDWQRWYRRSIQHSVDQLLGAERWIRQYPQRIFLDPECTFPLPMRLTDADTPKIHLVAVALGAYHACSQFYDDEDGFLMVASKLAGSDHVDRSSNKYKPFCVGDINPSGSFIHVFDEKALKVTMSELNTIADFVRYLSQRASYLRSGVDLLASSEAELLTYYLHNEDEDGNHIFPKYQNSDDAKSIFIPSGSYENFCKSPQYKAKRKADAISYNWDKIIKIFSDHFVAGTSISLDGADASPEDAERGLRVMALENRTVRRILASAFLDALRKAEEQKQDRFVQVVKPHSGTADTTVCYLFLIMAFKADHIVARGYDKYREMRTFHLRAYAEAIFNKHDDVGGILGIAIDASPRVTGRTGSSEDLMFIVRGERTQ